MNRLGILRTRTRSRWVNRVLGLGQVLLGLCAVAGHSQSAPPRLPFHLIAGVTPDEPTIPNPEPCRHLVCQNPSSNSPQNALGTSCRNQLRHSVKHSSKGDPDPNTPQHLWSGMVTQSISWSTNNTNGQFPRIIAGEEGAPTWNRRPHRPMRSVRGPREDVRTGLQVYYPWEGSGDET